MTLCDTNILIELYRGNPAIIAVIDRLGRRQLAVSDVTCAELYYGARNKQELRLIQKDLGGLAVIPIQADISTLAVRLMGDYCLSHKLSFPDALIAATAITRRMELCTLNRKDFVYLPGMRLYSL